MFQRRGDLSLLQEAPAEVGVAQAFQARHLQRHLAVEQGIVREVDDAKAAAADLALDDEAPDRLARQRPGRSADRPGGGEQVEAALRPRESVAHLLRHDHAGPADVGPADGEGRIVGQQVLRKEGSGSGGGVMVIAIAQGQPEGVHGPHPELAYRVR